jgi:large subunit ribosomal protein L1
VVADLTDVATAVGILQENSQKNPRKFRETVELVFNLNIDAKQPSQNVRGSVALPAGTGKSVRIVVFTGSEPLQQEALALGVVRAGLDNLLDEINGGFLDFDYCIATPDSMRSLSKVAKKLGPRGLMPNPKNGNVTDDVIGAIGAAQKGKIIFKNDKNGVLHTTVGKIDFPSGDLVANIKAVVSAIRELKPESIKNKYIKSAYLTTTMGTSVMVDVEKRGFGHE